MVGEWRRNMVRREESMGMEVQRWRCGVEEGRQGDSLYCMRAGCFMCMERQRLQAGPCTLSSKISKL